MEDATVNNTEKSKEPKESKEKGKTPKKNWWKGLKAEFSKIIWPDKETLVKESAAVVVVSIVLGLLIALVDWVIRAGIDIII